MSVDSKPFMVIERWQGRRWELYSDSDFVVNADLASLEAFRSVLQRSTTADDARAGLQEVLRDGFRVFVIEGPDHGDPTASTVAISILARTRYSHGAGACKHDGDYLDDHGGQVHAYVVPPSGRMLLVSAPRRPTDPVQLCARHAQELGATRWS